MPTNIDSPIKKWPILNSLIPLILDKILADYVQKNSIDIVLNKKDILMGKNNYNITDEILKIVNNTN